VRPNKRDPTETDDREARDRAIVLGCEIDRLNMAGTLERCRAAIDERRYTQHVSINAAKLVSLKKQPELREVIERCQLINADGQAVVWASRLLGDPLPERVAGIDLMSELVTMAEEHGYRIFILGARADVLQTAVDRLRERHPKLVIAGFHHGYFTDEGSSKIAAEIRATHPDILFVAMTSPRKEQWLGEYGSTLDVPLVMGVGGSIDVVAGMTKRAPRVWQRTGMEWLYRLIQEPKRLAQRYILTNAQFILLVVQAFMRRVWHGAH
jgi:N-acetylglucosaminyldiphosphoundecaprenol N-acetyl-beta-D-mannosaminyltransferase